MTHPDSSAANEYAGIAPLYDPGYAALAEARGDAPYYLDLARAAQGPVLELGCGTGRVLLPIAEAGIPCTGLDRSAAMLAALRRKPYPPTLRLVHASMQDFDLGEDRFTLIFSAFRGLQHLLDVEDQLECLACVRRHLAPGGAFAFDVFDPRFDKLTAAEVPEHVDLRFEHQGDPVVRYVRLRHDRSAQRIHLAMRYEIQRHNGASESRATEMTLRYFLRFELEHLLARAGFRDVRIRGDFRGSPLGQGGELVVIARA